MNNTIWKNIISLYVYFCIGGRVLNGAEIVEEKAWTSNIAKAIKFFATEVFLRGKG